MPFLFIETAQQLVAEAVIDLCMVARPDPNDALSVCRDVCTWIAEDKVANRGAMFGGLLCLGDQRTMDLLVELKWKLTDEEVGVAARSCSTMPTIAGVEFWLSWIEELIHHQRERQSLLGHVASGLTLLEKRRGVAVYRAIERNFGYAADPGSPTANSQVPLQVLEELTLSEVASRYADRMYALEDAEEPPKLVSMVLLGFGLEPKAPVDQRYVIQ